MSKLIVFLKNNWQEAGKWLIAAVCGLVLGKACDRIWPEEPVVVKEITDTIKIIHAISPLPDETDSLMKEQIQQQLLNIKLLNEYDSYLKQKKASVSDIPCKLVFGNPYPNSKGYVQKNSSALCQISLKQDREYIEITYEYLHPDYAELVNTLGVKVCKVDKVKGTRYYIMDQNYEPQKGDRMLIKIINSYGAGDYVLDAGFILKEDKLKEYPVFYSRSFSLRESDSL